MEIIEGRINELAPLTQPLAVTLGNFDGVHRGHKALVDRLRLEAKKSKLPLAILTFSPHPAEFFNPNRFRYLLNKKEKIEKIRSLGVDYLVIQEFDHSFAELSPQSFLDNYFLPYFSPEVIVFGYDFTFGKGGEGDFQYLKKHLETSKIKLYQEKAFQHKGTNISSSLIRKLLSDGEVEQANQFLTYAYRISGLVSTGDGIGKTLGFPTANLQKIPTIVPAFGVYWGRILIGDRKFSAVLNIGNRPTINGDKKRQVEAHILDFNEDIYGQKIEFEFLGRLRNEKKFNSLKSLTDQIEKDIQSTRNRFLEIPK